MTPVELAVAKIRAQRDQKAYRAWLRNEILARTSELRECNELMGAREGNFYV